MAITYLLHIVAFPTRIYLTGFMGSGKSTLGPIVANVLGYRFVDLDRVIVRRAGRSIPRIFAEEGEAAFRALEAEALRATAAKDRLVVAVGGGALTFEENMAWALGHGVVVYLYVAQDDLVERVWRGRTVRPLLQDEHGNKLSKEALRKKIERMLALREPFYRQAQLIVDVGGQRVGLAVDAVVRALRAYDRNA